MATIVLTAVLQQEEDVYVATCPEVGTVSQGPTVEQALANLREATELYLGEFPLFRASRPLLTTFEVTAEETVYAQAATGLGTRSHPGIGAPRFHPDTTAQQPRCYEEADGQG